MECQEFQLLVESHVSTATVRLQGQPVTAEISRL